LIALRWNTMRQMQAQLEFTGSQGLFWKAEQLESSALVPTLLAETSVVDQVFISSLNILASLIRMSQHASGTDLLGRLEKAAGLVGSERNTEMNNIAESVIYSVPPESAIQLQKDAKNRALELVTASLKFSGVALLETTRSIVQPRVTSEGKTLTTTQGGLSKETKVQRGFAPFRNPFELSA
jgi:hypothetical protein